MNVEIWTPDCPLCRYIAKGPLTVLPDDGSCVIQRGRDFVLIPDAAPVVPYHLLLVSLEHLHTAVMSMQGTEGELGVLKQAVRCYHKRVTGFETMFFEHGSCLEGGSSCLVHAHLHAVPLSQEHMAGVFKNALRTLGRPVLCHEKTPYIYAEFVEGEGLYWSDKLRMSQFFRLLIAQETGNPSRARWQSCMSSEDLLEVGGRWKNECVRSWRNGAA